MVRRSGRDDRGLPERRDRRRVRPPGLRPAEGPGPRRPGRGDPGPPVRVPPPELVAGRRRRHDQGTGGCSRNAAVQDRGTGCPAADPAIREAIAYAIDKNEINTRLLGGNAQVANTNISPSAWFYADQPPATFDPEKAKQILADGGWADSDGDGIVEKDGTKAKIELCTTTRQVRQDTLALISSWLKAVGIDSVINPVAPSDIFADYNEGTLDTPCILCPQQLRRR